MWHLGTPSFPTLGFCFATFLWTAFRSPVSVFAVQCNSCYGYVGGLPATNFPPPTAHMHIDGGRRVPSSPPHRCHTTRCSEGNAGGKPPWVLRGLVCKGINFFGNTPLPHLQGTHCIGKGAARNLTVTELAPYQEEDFTPYELQALLANLFLDPFPTTYKLRHRIGETKPAKPLIAHSTCSRVTPKKI